MPSDQPNVLFLMSDEHSFRCLTHCDESRGEPVDTPTFDRLASQGTNFDQTYCQMPLCTPSRLCMLTGREVRDCNAWRNSNVMPPDRTTLPAAFSEAGYDTSLVGKMHLGGSRQFVGFDDRPYGDLTGDTGHQWEPLERAGGRSTGDRTADAGVTEIPESQLQEYVTTRESLAWVREQEAASDDPWFLCASFSRPHFPLTAPRRYLRRYWDLNRDEPTDRLTDPKVEYEGDSTDHPMTEGAIEGFETENVSSRERQHARAAYFACVDFLDDIVGEFLAALDRDGTLEDTIVVYASDHGELAGEHGLWWKHTWHEAATRVPWFVQTPAHRRGDRDAATVETPTSLADLFPTLCGLAGVDVPDDLDGADLSNAVETGVEPDREPVFCDNLNPRWGVGTEFRLVRDGDYKYVAFRDAPELLFDLSEDPLEQENLAPDATGTDRQALERLRGVVAETMDFEAAASERERDSRLQSKYELSVETTSASGNCYLMPDGRVVDADEPLYDPTVVTAEPAMTYDDYENE
jgi:choline-sulfatase